MLNLAEIEVGLATVVYTDTSTYRHQTQFRRAEGYARDRGFGLWTEAGAVSSDTPSVNT
ncbi:thermonuclease family protein [Corynebacterium sp. SCR221107]|uniref:thermonuclease family protein n=1 Tax=Corynebacterium sp. SCR221107 TaxID=3017361 RepID=UPI0022EC9004|nr:thermonuclease family protein [Corynebacterium sp. SCR221107]WBT08248.1 thermonuclease family protein [Corynebacterium sp. SCR221107]